MMPAISIKKEKSIPFRPELTPLILKDLKTQTRRIINPSECSINHADDVIEWDDEKQVARVLDDSGGVEFPCPYGKVGDVIWVREKHALKDNDKYRVLYTDGKSYGILGDGAGGRIFIYHHHVMECNPEIDKEDGCWVGRSFYGKWRPSIHMNRVSSRIDLMITRIRVERLKDISVDDCFAEGITDPDGKIGWAPSLAKSAFFDLWTNINGPDSLKMNPWLWVLNFRRFASYGKPTDPIQRHNG